MKTKKTELDPSEILVDFDAMQSEPIKTEEIETIWDRDFRALAAAAISGESIEIGDPGRFCKYYASLADEMQKIRNERKEK